MQSAPACTEHSPASALFLLPKSQASSRKFRDLTLTVQVRNSQNMSGTDPAHTDQLTWTFASHHVAIRDNSQQSICRQHQYYRLKGLPKRDGEQLSVCLNAQEHPWAHVNLLIFSISRYFLLCHIWVLNDTCSTGPVIDPAGDLTHHLLHHSFSTRYRLSKQERVFKLPYRKVRDLKEDGEWKYLILPPFLGVLWGQSFQPVAWTLLLLLTVQGSVWKKHHVFTSCQSQEMGSR